MIVWFRLYKFYRLCGMTRAYAARKAADTVRRDIQTAAILRQRRAPSYTTSTTPGGLK